MEPRSEKHQFRPLGCSGEHNGVPHGTAGKTLDQNHWNRAKGGSPVIYVKLNLDPKWKSQLKSSDLTSVCGLVNT